METQYMDREHIVKEFARITETLDEYRRRIEALEMASGMTVNDAGKPPARRKTVPGAGVAIACLPPPIPLAIGRAGPPGAVFRTPPRAWAFWAPTENHRSNPPSPAAPANLKARRPT